MNESEEELNNFHLPPELASAVRFLVAAGSCEAMCGM